jgi:hypothetical protein
MAAGLARLAELVGPDSVIFPNLWGQPLIDLRFRKTIWSKLKATDRTRSAWDAELSYPRQGGGHSTFNDEDISNALNVVRETLLKKGKVPDAIVDRLFPRRAPIGLNRDRVIIA